ncbi:hypothetical protein KIPB_015556, partial [Kipferlia bialata]|eukprot:g15556.t1
MPSKVPRQQPKGASAAQGPTLHTCVSRVGGKVPSKVPSKVPRVGTGPGVGGKVPSKVPRVGGKVPSKVPRQQ